MFVVDGGKNVQGDLKVHVDIGEPETNALKHEILRLTLNFGDKSFSSDGKDNYDTFDEQLLDIKASLPVETYLKACWSCAWCGYPIDGSGI